MNVEHTYYAEVDGLDPATPCVYCGIAREAHPAARPIRDRLEDLVAEVGGSYALHQFDGGLNLSVTVPGRGAKTLTQYWEDTFDLVAEMRRRLREAGWMEPLHQFRLTFLDGTVATVRSIDARHATLLVGRGQPESVEDLGVPEGVS